MSFESEKDYYINFIKILKNEIDDLNDEIKNLRQILINNNLLSEQSEREGA